MNEARYTVTSACIGSGSLRLTPSLRRVFGEASQVRVLGPDGETYDLRVDREAGMVTGAHALFEALELAPNQQLRLVREGEVVSVEVVGRRVRSRPASEQRAKVLSGAVSKRQEKPAPPSKRVEVTPYPRQVLYPQQAAPPPYIQALKTIGLEASAKGSFWHLRSRMGRKAYTVVACREGELDPKQLLEAQRQQQATYALLVTASRSAEAIPHLAVASEEALHRLAELHRAFPLGPLELERLLAKGRITLDDLEALEREVEALLGERAAFSATLLGLSSFRKGQVFLLEDLVAEVGDALPGDVASRMLEVLSGPPFFALRAIAPGEFQMQVGVDELLMGLAAYAERLKVRLPV